VSTNYGWDGTDLSDIKLENFDPICVGPRGYDPQGSGQVGQVPVRMGHDGWDKSFF
jgi:hypothetical protein